MNWGPQQKNMYFFMESIMCGSCCENITAHLRQVVGVTGAEAIPFDQEKRKGGCLRVTTNLNLTADQLIAHLRTIPVNDNEFHRAQEITESVCDELISTYKRVKIGMK